MNAPAPKTSTGPDEALSSLMGAALGTPNTARPDSISAPAYGSPADVALRIRDYIGRHGREDTATLLLYEAMNALRRALARAAGDARDAAQVARWKRDSELLMAIQESCWDVRFLSHSNGDDCDISIEIVGHYMAAPHERVMGENYTENLRAALEQAMTADAYPPARPEYDENGHPVLARAAIAAQQGKGEAA